ncbi:MAG: hypothetical protein EPN30_11400 [Actinomycetota bacterium]|nr:MAG: hypothetical protein EPN30_11400 [Actinomycetota bacterium]
MSGMFISVSAFLLLVDLLAGTAVALKTVSYSSGNLVISGDRTESLPFLFPTWLALSTFLGARCFIVKGGSMAVATSTEMGLFPLLAAVDLRVRKVPTICVVFGLASTLISIVMGGGVQQLPKAVLAALIISFPMIISNLFRPGSIGQGDIRLAGYLGPLISISKPAAEGMVVVVISCVLAIGTAAFLRIGLSQRVKTLPFAPFLLGAVVLVQILPPGWLVH